MLETLNENYLARLVVSDSLNKVLTGTIETQETVILLWKEHGKTSEEIINTLEDSMREQQRRNNVPYGVSVPVVRPPVFLSG